MTFRALRESLGLAQGQIAEHAGLTRAAISQYERGYRTPPPKTADRLAKALCVDPAGLGEALEASTAPARPTVPHGPTERQKRPGLACCGPCGREIDFLSRRMGVRAPNAILPEPDHCRLCSRPLTDAAKAREPLDGYIALMSGQARRPATGRLVEWFGDDT